MVWVGWRICQEEVRRGLEGAGGVRRCKVVEQGGTRRHKEM